MGDFRLWLAALGCVCLLALASGAPGAMAAQPMALPNVTQPILIEAAQEGASFHHGRRTQAAYCLRRNYWWFYRPYTTAPADYARCEPYFHYLEPGYGPPGRRPGPYFK
jgi:hypothetical protein